MSEKKVPDKKLLKNNKALSDHLPDLPFQYQLALKALAGKMGSEVRLEASYTLEEARCLGERAIRGKSSKLAR